MTPVRITDGMLLPPRATLLDDVAKEEGLPIGMRVCVQWYDKWEPGCIVDKVTELRTAKKLVVFHKIHYDDGEVHLTDLSEVDVAQLDEACVDVGDATRSHFELTLPTDTDSGHTTYVFCGARERKKPDVFDASLTSTAYSRSLRLNSNDSQVVAVPAKRKRTPRPPPSRVVEEGVQLGDEVEIVGGAHKVHGAGRVVGTCKSWLYVQVASGDTICVRKKHLRKRVSTAAAAAAAAGAAPRGHQLDQLNASAAARLDAHSTTQGALSAPPPQASSRSLNWLNEGTDSEDD